MTESYETKETYNPSKSFSQKLYPPMFGSVTLDSPRDYAGRLRWMPLVMEREGTSPLRQAGPGGLVCLFGHKISDSRDGSASLFEHRGEDVPRVNHVGPHLEGDVDPRGPGTLRNAEAVIQ